MPTMTEEDLKEALKHLAFEVYHYRSYAQLVENVNYARMEPIATQALLYALLLHVRLLIGFFYVRPAQNDVCVEHFKILPEFAERFQFELIELDGLIVADVRENLNKRLVHFTTTRWSYTQKTLNY